MNTLLTKNNIDYLAAKHAQSVFSEKTSPKDIENTATKALGVLQENGVYACFLYLFAKEKDNGQQLSQQMCQLLKNVGLGDAPAHSKDSSKVLEFVNEHISQNMECLLLAKEVLEQMLIYVRYGAKAMSKDTPEKTTDTAS